MSVFPTDYGAGEYDPVSGTYVPNSVVGDTSGGDGGGFFSSFSSLLPGITSSVTSIFKTLNPPKPVSVSPGQVVYDPSSGTYRPAVTYPSGASSINPMFLLIAALVVILLVVRR